MEDEKVTKLLMPEARAPVPKEKRVTVEDQVRDAIDCVESGHSSGVEWLMLGRLYDALQQKKQTARIKNLIALIEPVLAKYGYHKVGNKT